MLWSAILRPTKICLWHSIWSFFFLFILLWFLSGEEKVGTRNEIFYFHKKKEKKKGLLKVLFDILSVCVCIKVCWCLLFKTTIKNSRHKYTIWRDQCYQQRWRVNDILALWIHWGGQNTQAIREEEEACAKLAYNHSPIEQMWSNIQNVDPGILSRIAL